MAHPAPDPLQLELVHGQVQHLPPDDDHDESWHRWTQREIDALQLAWAARRPLLVRGEPGVGKTQIARAVAAKLGWALQAITIDARTEPQDLLYRFDAVRRLADAQAGHALDEPLYWEPGPLWRAFGWASACRYGTCRSQADKVPKGHVILIDEVDKADSDLPNSLLEILGQRSHRFTADRPITLGGPTVGLPLVLITTNEERELPAAFLRRCMVLNLQPEPGRPYDDWLVERGQAHHGELAEAGRAERLSIAVLREAARLLCRDRAAAERAGDYAPGAAEYLDLLQALHALWPGDERQQLARLGDLSRYAFVKHRATVETTTSASVAAAATGATAS